MNERIREIADQILPNEKEFHQGDPKEWGYFFSGDELEKFAELIVKECMNLMNAERDDYANPGTYESWDYYERCKAKEEAFDAASDIIKYHFGVEE